jgi:ferredoxin-NADP reductase/Na+-translocating ferredoxin:NAD+ oxidoreductase RnfD subunit
MNSFINITGILLKKIFRPIDRLLDKLTMYKLVLYFLYVIVGWSVLASLLGQISFKWYWILLSAGWLVAICMGVNRLLSQYLNVPRNKESELITALILTLILSPAKSMEDFVILAFAAIVAMASKYILVISRWHVFNPAAFGAFSVGFLFHHHASWWVGTDFITPVVFIGGLLVLRKIKRYLMVIAFEITALSVIAWQTYLNQSASQVWHNVWLAIISTPLLFFAYIMLTEPLTSPRHLERYLPYAVLVGFLYSYITLRLSPEEALLIGNLFTYLLEPSRRMLLKFEQRIEEANGIESYVFSGKNGLKYHAGQYMEWTIGENNSDIRGNRRYFTLSSSPTEKEVMITMREPERPSSFKQKFHTFKRGDTVLAAQVSGEFTLPKSEKQKVAFLAGGVGITPFRSMVKYVVDFQQERDIHLLYSANSNGEFAFKDLFSEAKRFGVETSYETEQLNKDKIQEIIPDFAERVFYISGPYGFVQAVENALIALKIPLRQIKTDYFPGYG